MGHIPIDLPSVEQNEQGTFQYTFCQSSMTKGAYSNTFALMEHSRRGIHQYIGE